MKIWTFKPNFFTSIKSFLGLWFTVYSISGGESIKVVSLCSTQSMLHIPRFKVTPRYQLSLPESCCGLMYSFHSTVWNIENNSQDTIPAFVHFQALQISIVDIHGHEADFWPSSEQPAPHIWRENSDPSLGGQLDLSSWSESMQGRLITIRHGLHTTAPATTEIHPWGHRNHMARLYSQMLCFLGPSALEIYLGTYTAAWGAGWESEKGSHYSLLSELGEDCVWGDCGGFLWGRPHSSSEMSMGPGLRSWAVLLHSPRTPRTFLGDFIPPILASQRRPLRFKHFIFL